MKAFSFKRFWAFAVKHYAEYGRNYKFAIFTLIAVEVICRLLQNWTEDIAYRGVPYLMAYTLIVTYATKWSMGAMNGKGKIIDMTLPVNTIERYAFIWLNSYVIGVIAPTFILGTLSSSQNILPTLVAMTIAHALLLYVAAIGSGKAYGWLVILLLAAIIGANVLFEQLDIFPNFGYQNFVSLIPNGNIYMANIYENSAGHMVYRWDIFEPMADWIVISYNALIVLTLYAASLFKIRERRL